MMQVRMFVVCGALTAAIVLGVSCGSKAPKSETTTTSSRPASTSTSSSTTATAAPSTSRSTAATTTTIPAAVPYLYVYPFGSLADAEAWQRAAEPGGHQPWHLDPGGTAASFSYAFGVQAQIGQVIKVREDATGAHVALGFHNPNGVPVIAWTVHLVRVGSSSLGGRPWEVVGDDQSSDFTLTAPRYAATVASPVRVGGRITGVDENIRVRAYQGGHQVGERCCLPAGGDASPWSTMLSFSGATGPVLVITASTGGHLQAIERFVFTAVRRGS